MKKRLRLLDLFCGAGGCSVGYERAGFEVMGVDVAPQQRYPFEFHQVNAMNFPLDGFDAIHASPPCQAYSVASLGWNGQKDRHEGLIGAVRERLVAAQVPYVIENVPGAPLNGPVTYCGSSFGLLVRRHRLFESNVFLMAPPCDHKAQPPDLYPMLGSRRERVRGASVVGVYGSGGGASKDVELWKAAMGIDWMSEKSELSEAIPPAYTEHIGRQLLTWLS